MNQIKNRVSIVKEFDRAVELKLVRFGAKKFGHVVVENNKRMPIESRTRLDAAVFVAGRWNHQSYSDRAFVNPLTVSKNHGIDMALDFLLQAGLIRVTDGDYVKK